MAEEFPHVDYATWRAKVEQELKGRDFDRSLRPKSFEDFIAQPFYCAEDRGQPHNAPGVSPHRRGGSPHGGPGVNWNISQRHATPLLEEMENNVLADQAGGVDGAWIVFDRAARMGFDGDDSQSIEHAAVEGAPIHELSQLDQVIGGLHLEETRIHLDAGANALPAAALFFAICELRDLPAKETNLLLNADPISALARDGEIPGGLAELINESADLAKSLRDFAPKAKTFVVSTEVWQEAGLNSTQEIGIALATALGYLRALESSGMALESAANQIVFRIPMGRDLFHNIAKIRAARALWHSILESCGLDNPEACEFHATTGRRTLSRFDPWVNMLRTTSQTTAAILAGADEISSAAFDEMIGPTWWPANMRDFVNNTPPLQNSYERSGFTSSSLGRRVARNSHTILGEESHLGLVADPAGGSYYVEALTDEMAKRGWKEFQAIEEEGGIISALRNGSLHQAGAKRSVLRQARIRKRQDAITGISEYANLNESTASQDGQNVGEAAKAARQHLLEHRSNRGPFQIESCSGLADAIDAAKSGATLAEIGRALPERDEAECIEPIPRRRDADDFEQLREFADSLATRGKRPKVFLVTIGKQAEFGARVSFANNFFAAGGIECVVMNEGEKQPVEAWKKSGATAICLCGSDSGYEEDASTLAHSIRSQIEQDYPLMIAGRKDRLRCELPETTIPIFQGCDALNMLGGLLYLSDASEEATIS